MRAGFVLIAVCALLASCQQEPSFDERFDEHNQVITKEARSIEASVDERLKAAAEAEAALKGPEGNGPESGGLESSNGEIEPARSNQKQ